MQTSTLVRPDRFAGAADRTQPIAVRAVPVPRRTGTSGIRAAVLVACALIALVATATTAFVLGTRNATPVTIAPPASVIAPTAPAVPPVAEPGPALVDRAGRPVDPDVAAVVTRVYDALDAGELDPVRRAYSAAGSDDWYISAPHLRSAEEREGVLAALREAPSPHAGYLYAAGSYTVQFGQGDRYARPGLLTIDGAWAEETAPAGEDPAGSSAVAAPAVPDGETGAGTGTGCADGTLAVPTEGHPCQDPDTGRGVDRDGTVGVHGLKPCPYGTTVPSDPDEPTRNASTGEVCGL